MYRSGSSGRAAMPILVGIAACGITAFLVLRHQEQGREDLGPATTNPAAAEGPTGRLLRAEGVGSTPIEEASAPEYDWTRMTPDQRAQRLKRFAESPAGERMSEQIAELEALLGSEDAEEEKGDEAEEAWEEAWQRTVEALTSRAASPELARLMRERMDQTTDEAFATRLARILRHNEDPQFVAEMRERAMQAPEPLKRRMALLTLETKDARIWYEPVVKGFTEDAEPTVRDEAAGVFARSLVDRKHIHRHQEMRQVIAEQVGRDDPAQRARALRTLLADRRAGPEQLALAEAHVDDSDPRVREEAQRVLRVLGPRVKELLEKRGRN